MKTLNFGTQPLWEPMWAIDHRSKRIVEVAHYESREVRAALRSGFQDFVLYRNSLASEPLQLGAFVKEWDPWKYQQLGDGVRLGVESELKFLTGAGYPMLSIVIPSASRKNC